MGGWMACVRERSSVPLAGAVRWATGRRPNTYRQACRSSRGRSRPRTAAHTRRSSALYSTAGRGSPTWAVDEGGAVSVLQLRSGRCTGRPCTFSSLPLHTCTHLVRRRRPAELRPPAHVRRVAPPRVVLRQLGREAQQPAVVHLPDAPRPPSPLRLRRRGPGRPGGGGGDGRPAPPAGGQPARAHGATTRRRGARGALQARAAQSKDQGSALAAVVGRVAERAAARREACRRLGAGGSRSRPSGRSRARSTPNFGAFLRKLPALTTNGPR